MQSALLDAVVVLIECKGPVTMDGQLILFVQQYEEIYDFENPNYSNLQRRKKYLGRNWAINETTR
jgi:hypothetical protein